MVVGGLDQFPLCPKPKFLIASLRTAVLFPEIVRTGADLILGNVFPSTWKIPESLREFIPEFTEPLRCHGVPA
jgi:hypothetical protein